MPKRRARGEGSLRKRSDGRWEGRYTAGRDESGKLLYKMSLPEPRQNVKQSSVRPFGAHSREVPPVLPKSPRSAPQKPHSLIRSLQ